MPTLTSLARVREELARHDAAGALQPCLLRDLVVGSDALDRLPDVVRSCTPALSSPYIVLLVDETRIVRGERDVKEWARQLLAPVGVVRTVVLSDGHSELHVTDDVVQQAISGSTDAEVLVALGGGTISDIAKLVAQARPGIPLVTVMTAASVDGYTDDVSVTLKDGVKRTVPSVWPTVVLADAQTVAQAPARMNRAGYGEMTSMYVAPADWRLACLLGIDPSYHPAPVHLLSQLSAPLDACASGVAEGDPDAVEELTWALALRGIVTGVAGTTASLSGVEHLVSHMLDLRAAELGLPTGLHGEQVGVGSVIAACAWELLADRLAANPHARVTDAALDADAARARVESAFLSLDPTGRIGAECWRDYARKLQAITAQRALIDDILATWSAHEPELRGLARPSAVIARGLRSAGASATFADLEPEVSADVARWVVAHCALMRNRFTVVDLLTILGWWEDDDVTEVLARVEQAVGAVTA